MASLTSAFLRLRFALVKPLQAAPPSYHLIMVKNYCSNDCSSGIMGEKARSTAEEFKRQAKEKAESVSEGAKGKAESVTEGAKEAWKESTDSTRKSSEKDKFKETVDKGKYDKIGKA